MIDARSRSETIGFVEVLAAMALAGTTVVAGKVLQGAVSVPFAVFASFLSAFTVMVPLQLRRMGELRSLPGRELLLMFLQALCGMVLFRLLLLYGLRATPATTAGVITGAAPAVTMVLGRIVLRERLGGRGVAAVAVTAIGIIVLNLAARPESSAHSILESLYGSLLILCAVLCESSMTIFRKLSRRQVSAVTNTTVLSLFSSLLMLPFVAGELATRRLAPLPPAVWLLLAYYGAFATVVAYLLWGDGAMRVAAGRVGIATGAMPAVAYLLSVGLLREPFRLTQAAGCLLVTAGIVVGARRKAGHRARSFVAVTAQGKGQNRSLRM